METRLPLIIAFYSSVPLSGKSTAANYLTEAHGFYRPSFAGPLKKMLAAFVLNFCPYDKSPLEWLASVTRDKTKPITDIPGAPSYRDLQQTLGTGWGRHMVHADVWVRPAQMRLELSGPSRPRQVYDDLRFRNEAEMIKAAGGKFVQIIRPEAPAVVKEHESEGGLDAWPFDYKLMNNGTIEDLEAKLDAVVALFDAEAQLQRAEDAARAAQAAIDSQ